jgi:hypothetical protein
MRRTGKNDDKAPETELAKTEPNSEERAEEGKSETGIPAAENTSEQAEDAEEQAEKTTNGQRDLLQRIQANRLRLRTHKGYLLQRIQANRLRLSTHKIRQGRTTNG